MKKNLYAIPLVSIFSISSFSALHAAENNENNWYFSPMLSYIKADSDRKADNDIGVLLGVGKQINSSWNIEVSAAIDSLDFEVISGEYKQQGLMIDGLYFFDRQPSMQTYAVLGAGVMSTDIGATDSTNPMLNLGVGIMQQISDSGIKFRADIRYRMDMDDESVSSEDEFNDLMLNVGITIPFGTAQESQQTAVKTQVNNRDSDNDGVVDNIDRCHGTAADVQVDEKGCEIVVEEQVTIPAETMKEKDSDNDGVLDSKDQCPASTANANIDANGCELEQSFILKGVNFVTGSNMLTVESKVVLDDVAKTLKKNAGLNVEVAGYTDDRGNAGFNQRLSLKRAQAVKSYLESAGVNATQMTARGYGEDEPIADNSNSQGREQNRRVELHILK